VIESAYFEREYFTLHPGKQRYFRTVAGWVTRELGWHRGRVLDIGSGYGFLLQTLEEYGFEGFGIECSALAADQARAHCRATIAVQSAEARFPFADGFFDAVFMNDVIEHLRDYRLTLAEAFRTLAAGGVLFVETLNGLGVGRAVMGKRWTWYKDATHVHLFTVGRLRRELAEAGFAVRRSATFFNFCQVGESSTALRPLRRIGRVVTVPCFGDSFYVLARKLGPGPSK